MTLHESIIRRWFYKIYKLATETQMTFEEPQALFCQNHLQKTVAKDRGGFVYRSRQIASLDSQNLQINLQFGFAEKLNLWLLAIFGTASKSYESEIFILASLVIHVL